MAHLNLPAQEKAWKGQKNGFENEGNQGNNFSYATDKEIVNSNQGEVFEAA